MANPEEADVEYVEETEVVTTEETGSQDAEGKGESETQESGNLSLEEINSILKRDFKTKEEALKNLDGLKRLVGDQELAKERKKATGDDKISKLEQELLEMKRESSTNKFLADQPTAKEFLDILEAYAEKNNMSLDEAWKTDKFQAIAESSQRKVLTSKSRITPVQSERISQLADSARQGDSAAQDTLINELIWKK